MSDGEVQASSKEYNVYKRVSMGISTPRLIPQEGTTQLDPSGIPVQCHRIVGLSPFEALGHLNGPVLKPPLQVVPIDAFVDRVPIWCRVLVIQDPVERHDRCVEFAHQVLPDIIHAVLIVSLVHFGDIRLFGTDFGQHVDVMVLPYVVEAMDGMSAHCGGEIAAAC